MTEPKKRRWGLWLPVFLGILGLIVILVSVLLIPRKVTVEIKRQEIRKSNYHFIYEHWKEERLFELAKNEDFTALKGENQWDYFLKLCHWVHSQWKHSVPDPYPLCNAVDILRDIRSGKTGGFCGQYSYVLADVLKSMGYFAVRYVELWRSGGESHFVVEAWCDQYEKWVVLDADHDIYYEDVKTGAPLNAFEIRQSLFGERSVLARSAEPPHPSQGKKKVKLYANFAVSLRSDLMRHTRPLTVQDRFQMFLFFKDRHTNEYFMGPGQKIPYVLITGRIEDLYFDCHCVRVEYEVAGDKKKVRLKLFTDQSMPNFMGFALSPDGGRNWNFINGNQFDIRKSEKVSHLLVAPVNMYRRYGCVNEVKIYF